MLTYLSNHFQPVTEEIVIKSRPRGGLQKSTHWKSEKGQRTLSLTQEVWSYLDIIGAQSDCNRSECIEILVRHAHRTGLDLQGIRREILTAPTD